MNYLTPVISAAVLIGGGLPVSPEEPPVDKEWTKAVEIFEKGGGSVNIESYFPALIPEEENFGAIEPLRGITIPPDFEHDSGIDGEAVRKALSVPLYSGEDVRIPPFTTQVDRGMSANLNEWLDYIANEKEKGRLPASDKRDAAREILKILNTRYEHLFSHSDPASTLPGAQFVPRPSDFFGHQKPLEVPSHHGTNMIQLSQVLWLRTAAAARCGEREIARKSLLTQIHFFEMSNQSAIGSLGTMVSGLQITYLRSSLMECFSVSLFDPETMDMLQDRLNSMDYLKSFETSNRLSALQAAMFLREGDPGELDKINVIMEALSLDPLEISSSDLDRLTRERIDKLSAEILTTADRMLIKPVRNEDFADMKAQIEQFNAREGKADRSADDKVMDFFLIFRSMSTEAVRYLTYLRISQSACAVERYAIKHKAYPESLAELVPEFLSEVPLDPMGRDPLRYRRTDDGRFLIYSIGWDLEDGGGYPDHNPRMGDWLWTYTDRVVPDPDDRTKLIPKNESNPAAADQESR